MPLSSKDLERLALAWQCFETEPRIDYAKFAEVAGLASAASARELMRVTKNKLKSEYGALSSGLQKGTAGRIDGAVATPKRKSGAGGKATPTPTPRKKKANAKAAAGEDDDEVGVTAKKRAKTEIDTPGVEGEGEDDAGNGVSPVKTEPEAAGEAEDFGFF